MAPSHMASAPELRSGRHSSINKAVGQGVRADGPTPAARLGMLGMRQEDIETPAHWTVPRYAPHMAGYVMDAKSQHLRPSRPLAQEPKFQAAGCAPPRKVIKAEENDQPTNWSVPRYALNATKRVNDPRWIKTRTGPMAKSLSRPREAEAHEGGLAAASEEDCDTPHGWTVKRYAPHMAGFVTDSACGWRLLRAHRAPVQTGPTRPAEATGYMDKGNRLCRDNVQRPRLHERTIEEHSRDVPYGWTVPRYDHKVIPRLSPEIQDPAARLHAGAAPRAAFAAGEFVP
eukprot:TRINITY_DN4896_c0_g2_i1.p1 TRINITY_DN4896_c0_g2~~TRINITY_DN4896_c0_g2_i1.p1  ORF type:complete len:286 (+),score=30.76 TRINITY_DN4896_c0_g2_i1:106-963(+)